MSPAGCAEGHPGEGTAETPGGRGLDSGLTGWALLGQEGSKSGMTPATYLPVKGDPWAWERALPFPCGVGPPIVLGSAAEAISGQVLPQPKGVSGVEPAASPRTSLLILQVELSPGANPRANSPLMGSAFSPFTTLATHLLLGSAPQ